MYRGGHPDGGQDFRPRISHKRVAFPKNAISWNHRAPRFGPFHTATSNSNDGRLNVDGGKRKMAN